MKNIKKLILAGAIVTLPLTALAGPMGGGPGSNLTPQQREQMHQQIHQDVVQFREQQKQAREQFKQHIQQERQQFQQQQEQARQQFWQNEKQKRGIHPAQPAQQ